jgi:hypothetical protein
MGIQFRRNLGELMQAQQDAAALGGHQAGDFRLAGTPAAPKAAPIDPLQRAVDLGDMEASRQLSGEVFSPGAPSAPPTRTFAVGTPQQSAAWDSHFSSNRQLQEAQIEGENAMRFAETVAPAQATQRQLDALRGASAGYQQPDTTDAFVRAQEAQEFANQQVWSRMSPQGRGMVDAALLQLSERPM